jgi:7,8-dihydro-6-hydroxymethylpterin dimethyltransferase
MSLLTHYQRLEFEGTPIYVDPEQPDWLVPTDRGDFVLRRVTRGKSFAAVASEYSRRFGTDLGQAVQVVEGLCSRIEAPPPETYLGRARHRELRALKECWLHITNQCNMACRHCLFASDGAQGQPALPYEALLGVVKEALSLGCRVFYFTGGEPLIHPDFTRVADAILRHEYTQVVILTNGKALRELGRWLGKKPRERIHFQVSIDGREVRHDEVRGKGAFRSLMEDLRFLQEKKYSLTLAMAVTGKNVQDMGAVVGVAEEWGAQAVHYLWLFAKGKARRGLFVSPDVVFPALREAYEQAEAKGITIDNVEAYKTQIFSLPGTRFDLSNAAWESVAVGPEGRIYPSPALVGEKRMAAGTVAEGLENVWRKSPVMSRVRAASLLDDERTANDPLRYFVGGGDLDHSYHAGRSLAGADDPYRELYRRTVLYLLSREASRYRRRQDYAGVLCRMGERLLLCEDDLGPISFTHSNCVLTLPGKDAHHPAEVFYGRAADAVNSDIMNPVWYPEGHLAHIPEEARMRSYGCGSPVLDCEVKHGEVVVDLGCGAGLECFIAAKGVGAEGRVYGIDMLDVMLTLARRGSQEVAARLGYENLAFRHGLLEAIPLESEAADAVISNCVINLSPDKRRTFAEIARILKPGGRLCISDIVCEERIPLDIAYNERLRGECIGGALRDIDLFALLEDLGFVRIEVLKRFLYREVKGHRFYSLTYRAFKAEEHLTRRLLYRGPFAAVVTEDGKVLRRGVPHEIRLPSTGPEDDAMVPCDPNGGVTTLEQGACCCCAPEPAAAKALEPPRAPGREPGGCMICGEALEYQVVNREEQCQFCGRRVAAPARCPKGHFVCDQCHSLDALAVIKTVALQSREDDLIRLLTQIRNHPAFPLHGPEHHALVPAIILSAYRCGGGRVGDDKILTAIERGSTVAGGSCSFWGICGAAVGVGIAFALLLEATPYAARERKLVMEVTREVTERIAEYEAPRCCQRESWIALKSASELSRKYLPVILRAQASLKCAQWKRNQECIGADCPLWPGTAGRKT